MWGSNVSMATALITLLYNWNLPGEQSLSAFSHTHSGGRRRGEDGGGERRTGVGREERGREGRERRIYYCKLSFKPRFLITNLYYHQPAWRTSCCPYKATPSRRTNKFPLVWGYLTGRIFGISCQLLRKLVIKFKLLALECLLKWLKIIDPASWSQLVKGSNLGLL